MSKKNALAGGKRSAQTVGRRIRIPHLPTADIFSPEALPKLEEMLMAGWPISLIWPSHPESLSVFTQYCADLFLNGFNGK